MTRHFHMTRPAMLVAALLALAGCSTMPQGTSQGAVRELVQQRSATPLPDVPAASVGQHTASLLAQPLTADNAVAIALLNNRTLQASYAELSIAEADLVQAGRIPNPVFSFGRLKNHHGVEVERTLTVPLIGLLTMPITRPLELRRTEVARMRTAGDALRIADDTRRAFYSAVAAEQSAIYIDQVRSAAEASAELALRMAQAGNWSKLQQAREQAFYADTVAQLARARQARTAEREKLTRLMGLDSPTAFQLPDRLPELPAAPRDIKDAEAEAMTNRLDILMPPDIVNGLVVTAISIQFRV